MSVAVVEAREVTMLELLDRVLESGVVLAGDLTISVAGVDLVFLGLKALLTSVRRADQMRWNPNGRAIAEERATHAGPCRPDAATWGDGCAAGNVSSATYADERCADGVTGRALAATPGALEGSRLELARAQEAPLGRVEVEPTRVEQGLAKLALTLIELLRRLLEKQATRRMDDGELTDDQVERLGETFAALERRMAELKLAFGLEGEELNLHLGPLGDLL